MVLVKDGILAKMINVIGK